MKLILKWKKLQVQHIRSEYDEKSVVIYMLGLKESSYAYSEKELLRMVLNDNNIFWN
jgi:hypothetical protein